jgi:hypothetical protein
MCCSISHLSGEIPDNIRQISTPQGNKTLIFDGTREAFTNALVGFCKTTRFQHLILVLYEELDSFNWCSRCLGHSSRNTSHKEVHQKPLHTLLLRCCNKNRSHAWRHDALASSQVNRAEGIESGDLGHHPMPGCSKRRIIHDLLLLLERRVHLLVWCPHGAQVRGARHLVHYTRKPWSLCHVNALAKPCHKPHQSMLHAREARSSTKEKKRVRAIAESTAAPHTLQTS